MDHKPVKTPVGVKRTDLWEKYKELLKEFQEKEQSGALTTTAAAQQQKISQAIQTADGVNVDALESRITGLLSGFNTAKAEYDQLLEAIEAKKKELKEVHQLEVAANSLVAVVTAKDELVAEREQQAAQVLTDAKEKAEELLAQAREQVKQLKETAAQEKREQVQANEREQEQWEYDFAVSKRNREGELQEALTARLKEMQNKEIAVAEREAQADAKDNEIAQLKTNIEQLQAGEQARIDAAVEKAKKGMEQSYNISKAMDKKSHEAEMSIATARIETLTQQAADLNNRLERAQTAVELANTKVAEMAAKALQAGADKATIAEISKTMAGASGKK